MALADDTIFALATPPGRSAIAVVRISGPKASILPAHFGASCPRSGRFARRLLKPAAGTVIDDVLLLFMAAPRSSTGEDVLEIHCHGGVAIIRSILDNLALIDGVRPAEAGEFTHRMFHHGKIDLLGVEGLADVIDAETSQQLDQAWAQMQGALRKPVRRWREGVIDVAAKLEAIIDFPDEDVPQSLAGSIRERLAQLNGEIITSLDDDHLGERLREGVQITLLGPVNAGKSTLLNRVANRPVAIVSSEAGTTRDLLTVNLDIGGVPVTLIDTAGMREEAGAIEMEGMDRALASVRQSDHTVIVLDGSDATWTAQYAEMQRLAGQNPLLVLNKSDRGVCGQPPDDAIVISVQEERGIDDFLDRLTKMAALSNRSGKSAIITRSRHRQSLQATARALQAALQHNVAEVPEIVAEELRVAATALGRITGEIDVEDLLDAIFSSFCIGK